MKPFIKRLPVSVSYRDDILLWGTDNLYPQRVEEVILASPITKSAIQVQADFINGDGFESDTQLGEYTANELLNLISPDFSTYTCFAAILDVNLDGEIVDIYPVDVKYVRLGTPNKKGEIKTVKVNVDWEEQLPLNLRPKMLTYILWPGKDAAKQIIEDWDFESQGEFPGFCSFITPRKNQYPLCTVDAVLDSSQSNAEIQVFELAGIQNGFQSASVLKHQGKIATEEERYRLMNLIDGVKGAENANSILLWEVPDGYEGEVLEQIPANDQDKLFEQTNKATVNRIVQALAIPPALLGIMPENSFFTMQEITDSYNYFNVRTNRKRGVLSRILNDIAKDFVTPAVLGNIKPQQFNAVTNAQPNNTN